MIPIDDPRRSMYNEVLRRPAFIREHLDELDDLVRSALPRQACQAWTRVLLTGCGDSYYAGLASELAFETCTALPVSVQPALQGGRYTVPSMAAPAVVFSVSHSGRVSRTIETVALARARGLDTVAVSGTPGSPITHEAGWVLACWIDVTGRTPGVRSYTQALLLLFLAAIHIGECRGVLDPGRATALKEELRHTADILDAVLTETDTTARTLAEAWRESDQFLVVGGGPSYANALFSAAKLVEACGVNAVGQELEEWAHIQFFLRSPRLPTIVIAPPGRCAGRAIELLQVMEGLGCEIAVIGATDDPALRQHTQHRFDVPGSVGEAFSPLVTSMAVELLACYLAHVRDEPFFRADGRGVGVGRGRITDSRVLRSLSELSPPFNDRSERT